MLLGKFDRSGNLICQKNNGGDKSDTGSGLIAGEKGNLVIFGSDGPTTSNMDFGWIEIDTDGNE